MAARKIQLEWRVGTRTGFVFGTRTRLGFGFRRSRRGFVFGTSRRERLALRTRMRVKCLFGSRRWARIIFKM